jgi:hypothetical protein
MRRPLNPAKTWAVATVLEYSKQRLLRVYDGSERAQGPVTGLAAKHLTLISEIALLGLHDRAVEGSGWTGGSAINEYTGRLTGLVPA